MKKLLILGVGLLVAANAFTIYYTNRQMHGLKQTIADLQGVSIKLPPALEARLESMIVGAESNIVEMCRSRVLGNKIEADLAYQKAVRSLGKGDLAMAKIYCMNAINHSPTKKVYFKKLVEISGKSGEETRDDLEQIKGALELGLFQVAADDVLGMRDLLAGVIEKIGNMDKRTIASQQETEKASMAESLETLREGDLRYESVIAREGTERIALLQYRLAVLQGLNKESMMSNDVAWVEAQDVRTRATLEYYGLVSSTDAYLTRAERILNEDTKKMASVNLMVQTASQSLNQALGMDSSALPDTSADDLQALAERIEAIEIKFNKIKSGPAVAEVNELLDQVNAIGVFPPYQVKLEALEDCLARIAQKMALVYDLDERNALEGKVKKAAEKVGQCRQAQYKAYQKWAIERCNAGMEKYKSWIRVDIVDAEYVVYNYLVDIDTTLLTPDVARLYQDVLGKQFAELKDHTVKVELDLAKHKKRQLSDF